MAACALAVASPACSRDGDPPEYLVDGARAVPPPLELADVTDSPILTTVRVTDVSAVETGSRLASCLRSRLPARPAGTIVERIGVASATVTFRDSSGGWLQACDDVGPTDDLDWCGGASGRLFQGRLRDPRLRIAACTTPEGDPVGFAWVEPTAAARYLVVRHDGYAEGFEAAAGLPVRVATGDGVSIEGARATFELTEHDGAGEVLRRYVLDASVAG